MSDPQFEIKAWMRQHLARRGVGAKTRFAAALGVGPDFVARMINIKGHSGNMRSVPAHFIPKIAAYFGDVPPGFEFMAQKQSPSEGHYYGA